MYTFSLPTCCPLALLVPPFFATLSQMPVDPSHLLQKVYPLLQSSYTARLPPRGPGCYLLHILAFLWAWNFANKTTHDSFPWISPPLHLGAEFYHPPRAS